MTGLPPQLTDKGLQETKPIEVVMASAKPKPDFDR